MKPYLSIVIPYYNSTKTIGPLLTSIAGSKGAPTFEVIVADDGSKENVKFQMSNVKWKNKNKLRTITLNKNLGPAAARNRGAALARGKFLVFLDSDVELFPDTLRNLAQIYLKDPDVVALTGVWLKSQRSKAFFPNFKALRDWSYWINERDVHGYYFLFSTRIASIKKSVFKRLGGFNESYHAALVEDIEFTYRIASRYAIIFAPNVRVRHEFGGFWEIAKKYYLRSFHWARLFRERNQFDSVATTGKEAMAAISGVALVGLLPLRIVTYFTLPHSVACLYIKSIYVSLCVGSVIQWLFIIIFLLHLFLVRKFIWFAAREKGRVFAAKSFAAGLVLYCFITAGAIMGRVK